MADHNWGYITAAYTVTWVVILGYTVGVHKALRRARHEYERAAAESAEDGQ
jgi:CcmD family protein